MRRAGWLNTRIEIYEVQYEKNEYGTQVENLVLREPYGTTMARVTQDYGNRDIVNDEIFHPYSFTIITRSYVVVGDYDKIKIGDDMYRVISVFDNKEFQDKEIKVEKIND